MVRRLLNISPAQLLVLIFNQLDGKEAAAEVKSVMRKIAHNVDDVNRSSSVLSPVSQASNTSTGRQLRESLRKWQSPSDPSTSHNIACSLQHEGTALWFCGGDIFEEWMVTGSLLWIHGKRTFFFLVILMSDERTIRYVAGSGKSVLWSVTLWLSQHKEA